MDTNHTSQIADGAVPETLGANLLPGLYVVATPMGNLADISLRALVTLRGTDIIACEDTRHSQRLMQHYGVTARLLAVHEHNEAGAAGQIVARIQAGEKVALVTDAGTPCISDPGSRVVAAVQAAGLPVVPVPGASAVITALSAAGLESGQFLFHGFLPPKATARKKLLTDLANIPAALVFYEAPHRVSETVADLVQVLGGERELVLAKELTKLFETIVRLPLAQATAWLAADPNRQRGEFVLIVAPPPQRQGLDPEAERVLRLLLADGLPVKQAARLSAEITGAAKNDLYQRALELGKT